MSPAVVLVSKLDFGGTERFCVSAVNALVQGGVNVVLRTTYPGGQAIRSVDKRAKVIQGNRPISRSAKEVVRLLRTYSSSPVLCLSGEIVIVVCLLKRLGLIGNKIYYRESVNPEKPNILWKLVYKFTYPLVHCVIAQTIYGEGKLREYYGGVGKIRVVRNICDFVRVPYSRKTSCRNLLAVGRLSVVKGFDRLFRALGSWARTGSQYRLTVVGSGEDRAEIIEAAKIAGVCESVNFVGGVSPTDVKRYYLDNDCLVVASYKEGLPNVMIEAIMSGCRVVVAECLYGAVELLKEIGLGLVVVRGSFEENLKDAIDRAMSLSADAWNSAQGKLLDECGSGAVMEKLRDVLFQ